jgi:hypothetical protein
MDRHQEFRECRKCHEVFPKTAEHFVPLKNKPKNWHGWSAECRSCRNLRFKPYYEKNREKLIATKSTSARRATEAGAEKAREWARNQKRRELIDPIKREEHNARGRKWRADNPEKARQFKHNQAPYKLERVMRRYVRERHATPAWADHEKIDAIYAIAEFLTRATGIEHQIDYPILGKTSCGLHVHQNMRVITAKANQTKGNRAPSPALDLASRETIIWRRRQQSQALPI